MSIWLVTPAPHSSLAGNRTPATHWAAILRHLGPLVPGTGKFYIFRNYSLHTTS